MPKTDNKSFIKLFTRRLAIAELIRLSIDDFKDIDIESLASAIEPKEHSPLEVYNYNKEYKRIVQQIISNTDESNFDYKFTPDVLVKININKLGEKYTRLDKDRRPNDWVLLNLEMQRSNTGDIFYRAYQYVNLMVLDTLDKNTPLKEVNNDNNNSLVNIVEYNQIRNVYSIWICEDDIVTNRTKRDMTNTSKPQFINNYDDSSEHNISDLILNINSTITQLNNLVSDLAENENIMQQIKNLEKHVSKIEEECSKILELHKLPENIINYPIHKYKVCQEIEDNCGHYFNNVNLDPFTLIFIELNKLKDYNKMSNNTYDILRLYLDNILIKEHNESFENYLKYFKDINDKFTEKYGKGGESMTLELYQLVLDEKKETLDKVQETLDEKKETLGKVQETLDKRKETLDEREETLDEREETLDEREETLDKVQETFDKEKETFDKEKETFTELISKSVDKDGNIFISKELLATLDLNIVEE